MRHPNRVREIDDPAALRALAHPLRLQLLASLRIDGPATATMLAQRTGESSGSTSYHLRSLAKHGFVVDDESRADNARERWWCAADAASAWSLSGDDPAGAEAGRGLTRQVVSQHAQWGHRFLDELEQWDEPWRRTALFSDRWVRVTPERLEQMAEEISAVLERYVEDPSDEPEAERVMVVFDAIPQKGTAP